jgi:hypothetical protein
LILISMRSVAAVLHQMILNISAAGVSRAGEAYRLSDLVIIPL